MSDNIVPVGVIAGHGNKLVPGPRKIERLRGKQNRRRRLALYERMKQTGLVSQCNVIPHSIVRITVESRKGRATLGLNKNRPE